MIEDMKVRVEAILGDDRLDKRAKIARLRQMEIDVLARQRASTEGMEPSRPIDGEDLRIIEHALIALGEKPRDQGPASL
jgi:hypothetical protein